MSQHTPPPYSAVWLAPPEAAARFDPSCLAAGELAEWTALRTERRRLDWACSRALLSAVPDAGNHIRSLSHSHGFAALALTPATIAVGVDIEWMASRDFKSMAGIAYSHPEAAYLASLEDPVDLCARFYEYWTLKEAFAKAMRLPLVDTLRHYRFVDATGRPCAEIPLSLPWRAMVFAPRPQLRLAVVRIVEPASLLESEVATLEWPHPRGRQWPLVLDLASGDGPCGPAR